jgi:glycyl-tRNA synthetase
MTALTFQQVILKLNEFWAEYGCVVWHPYNQPVGAGTMNPATVLRVLGAEPWKVAYLEPSVRPDDGRYGQNPNRLNQHYQYQVILQPGPADPQEVYLKSLEAIGINLREHDIRFVEDNWESPALGAWGLGWEVWLDGQEITQFTYFQQAGGLNLKAPAVEITYGLERIVMGLRHIRDFQQIPWVEQITYGDVNLQAEQEHSAYHFEVANVTHLRTLFDIYESECQACLARGLVLPAHDCVLRCSHTFNILDTRGAVGVTERANYFKRMRNLSRAVSKAYVEQREALGLPFENKFTIPNISAGVAYPMPAEPTSPLPYLLEIGCEELPAEDVDQALAQLREKIPALLADARLTYRDIDYYATPRRLAVLIYEVSTRQADRVLESRGPAVSSAFDAHGKPTKAAEGFARGKGVTVADLERRLVNGVEYLFAVVPDKGQPAPQVLAKLAQQLVSGLQFKRSMRWLDGDATAFSRPVRWLVSILGDQVVPFQYAGLNAGKTSRGVRAYGSPAFQIDDAYAYGTLLGYQHIMPDVLSRREYIAAEASALASTVGGSIPNDPDLLAEVANLVEQPTVFLGAFEERFLTLPKEVLIAVMRKHQRYFPVEQGNRLLPYFVAVRNGDREHLDVVTIGNEQVIRARFADAAYFVRQDEQKPLSAYRPRLSKLTFQEQLGSMLDKSERIEKLTTQLANVLVLTATETSTAERAAHLCKADLATQMVVEMTSLQGVIGREYALRSGETQAVAEAIEDHYLPAGQGDRLPRSLAAVAVGLADRLDSLVGLFAVGLAPTASADPFALRRAALGIVQIVLDRTLDVDLAKLVNLAAQLQSVSVSAEVQNQVVEFMIGRLTGLLKDAGRLTAEPLRHDVIEAALSANGKFPLRARQNAQALQQAVHEPAWEQWLDSYARCVRITRDQAQQTVDASQLQDPQEKALYQAVQKLAGALPSGYGVSDFVSTFRQIIPQVTAFFDKVMVMSPNLQERANRIGILQQIAHLGQQTADFSKLEGF